MENAKGVNCSLSKQDGAEYLSMMTKMQSETEEKVEKEEVICVILSYEFYSHSIHRSML